MAVRITSLPSSMNASQLGKKGGTGGVRSRVRVQGLPQALAKLKGVDSVVRLDLGLLTKGAAEFIEKTAKEFVNKETGNLASGIHAERVASYSWQVIASSMDGTVAEKNWYEYAPFVEYGTSNMEGQFFMTRAHEEVRPLIAAEMVAIKTKLERL